MQNVQMAVNGNVLTITVALDAQGVPSKTGKTLVLASTHGNVPVPDRPDMRLGLNIYRSAR